MERDTQFSPAGWIRQPASTGPTEVPGELSGFHLSRSQKIVRGALHLLDTISPRAAAELAVLLFLRPRRRPVTYVEKLPTGAREIDIFYDLCRLRGYSWGRSEKTLLLIHGWESHIGRMLPLVTPLVNAGFRVVALDLPGHGQSPRWLTNMYDVGEAIYSALRQLTPVYGVIASSFGAAATMNLLAREPEVQPAKLVLLSPMAHLEQHLDIFNRLVGIDGRLKANMRQVLQSRLPLHIEHFDVAAAAKKIGSKGLVIHDQHDSVIPIQSIRPIVAEWDAVRFMETSHRGHKRVVTSTSVQAAVVDFLLNITQATTGESRSPLPGLGALNGSRSNSRKAT